MLSQEWKIHKKLLDAGGLGPVVYIYPARGNSKPVREFMRYLELVESGRTVVYVRPKKSLLGARNPWSIMDRDILTPEQYERAERFWNEFWKERKNEN